MPGMWKPTPDPTEEEIAAACAAIRRTWSSAERRRRRAKFDDTPIEVRPAMGPLRWDPPVIRLSHELADAFGLR
jgi:hypothetical protein